MFRRRAYSDWESERIKELRAEKAILLDRLSQLKNTRIRYSVKINLGVTPVWDVPIEYAIMQTHMQGGQGRELPAGTLEIISQYTPIIGEDNDDADDLRPWD